VALGHSFDAAGTAWLCVCVYSISASHSCTHLSSEPVARHGGHILSRWARVRPRSRRSRCTNGKRCDYQCTERHGDHRRQLDHRHLMTAAAACMVRENKTGTAFDTPAVFRQLAKCGGGTALLGTSPECVGQLRGKWARWGPAARRKRCRKVSHCVCVHACMLSSLFLQNLSCL